MLRPIQWQITMLKAGQEDLLSKDAASSASQFAMRQEAIEAAERDQSQVKRKENTPATNKLAADDRNSPKRGNFSGKKKRRSQLANADAGVNSEEKHEGLDIYA